MLAFVFTRYLCCNFQFWPEELRAECVRNQTTSFFAEPPFLCCHFFSERPHRIVIPQIPEWKAGDIFQLFNISFHVLVSKAPKISKKTFLLNMRQIYACWVHSAQWDFVHPVAKHKVKSNVFFFGWQTISVKAFLTLNLNGLLCILKCMVALLIVSINFHMY